MKKKHQGSEAEVVAGDERPSASISNTTSTGGNLTSTTNDTSNFNSTNVGRAQDVGGGSTLTKTTTDILHATDNSPFNKLREDYHNNLS